MLFIKLEATDSLVLQTITCYLLSIKFDWLIDWRTSQWTATTTFFGLPLFVNVTAKQFSYWDTMKQKMGKKVQEGRTKPWSVIGHPNRACSVSEDGWALTSSCFTCLWASTLCWSIIHNKRHLANIQPSWPPRVWSIPVCLATGWIKKHSG